MAENEAAIRGIRERIKELQASHAAQVHGVMERYNALRRTVGDYNAQLEAAVGAATTTTAR